MQGSKKDFSIYKTRRKELLQAIRDEYKMNEHSAVMLTAGFEYDRAHFWQESSFYYYTGITEPGTVLIMDATGKTSLYIPNCGTVREKWVYSPISLTQENAKLLGVDTVTVLGDQCAGYQLFPYFKSASYGNIIAYLKELTEHDGNLFTLYPDNEHAYVEQRLILDRLKEVLPSLKTQVVDISSIVAQMRRRKDMHEIDCINKAVEITELAHEAAAQAVEHGILECEVQAGLEYMMTGSGSRPAFPSIVASGRNGTVLHYRQNEGVLQSGELVVVDIGAVYEGYCADLTRTYPVSGTFTKRQRELYNIVLDTQEYIADKAVPGMYLNNPDQKEKSLHHLAKKYLQKHGLDQYFIHGIGHFLGLDVHDVGSAREPLKEHDVFTIEPGIYIPEENIGIRIEDDYWMAKKGAICLSENLPKKASAVEQMVQQALENQTESDPVDEEIFSDDFTEH